MCKLWKAGLEKVDTYGKKNPEKAATDERYVQNETKRATY